MRINDDGDEVPCRCTEGEDHDDRDFSGSPQYCCGAIYENGEDTCMSCGEAL